MLSLCYTNKDGFIEELITLLQDIQMTYLYCDPYFEQTVSQIYPTELQLNKVN